MELLIYVGQAIQAAWDHAYIHPAKDYSCHLLSDTDELRNSALTKEPMILRFGDFGVAMQKLAIDMLLGT